MVSLYADSGVQSNSLSQQAARNSLVEEGAFSKSSERTVQALSSSQLGWLGNVPIEALVQMRSNGENEQFRRKLDLFVRELSDADIDNLDKVSAQVVHGISALLQQHQHDIKIISEKYQGNYTKIAVGTWITLVACFMPWLPAATPAAGLVLLGKYASDKAAEILEKRQKGKTILGVLSTAKSSRS